MLILKSDAILMDYPVNGGNGGGEVGCFGGDPYWDYIWCKTAVSAVTVGACALLLIAFFFEAFYWCMEAIGWFQLLHNATAVCIMFGCC